jgi:hypothetical protein
MVKLSNVYFRKSVMANLFLSKPMATLAIMVCCLVISLSIAQAATTGTSGTCGSANGHGFTVAPSTNLCGVGTASALSISGANWVWKCAGTASTTSCKAVMQSTSGKCGTASGQLYTSAPSTGLCAAGTPSTISNFNNTWTWSCTHLNSGTDASCQAAVAVASGECGWSAGTSVVAAPTDGLCAGGVASVVTGSGPYAWTCKGTNKSSSCSASKSASFSANAAGYKMAFDDEFNSFSN